MTGVNVWDVTEGERSRWRTHGERTVYEDPWVWLGQVDVEVPGSDRFWHNVVRLRRAAIMVLVDDLDRVLLLWRHRFVADRWGWELPGGLIDPGEEPADAVVRELEEETGYRAGRVERLVEFQPMVGTIDAEHVVFAGHEPELVAKPTEIGEADRIEWVPLARVRDLIKTGQIWNAGTLIGLLSYQQGKI